MRKKLNLLSRLFAALPGLLAVCLLATGVSAQTNRPPAKASAPLPDGNRFLFIVDTSDSMRTGAGDALRSVAEIIRTGASGQLHKGDTLGVWTFNTDLYAGQLPLQAWAPEDMQEIALRTLEFLRNARSGGQCRLDKALDGMFTVIKNSDIITIFLISSGQNRMQGTPFDDEINALYAESLKEMKKDRKPIVTVLQAKGGKIIKYTVNALPWPVVIPEVPIPIRTSQVAAATPPAVKPQNAAPPTNAPAVAPKPLPPPIVAVTNPVPAVTPTAVAPLPPPTVPKPVIAAQPPSTLSSPPLASAPATKTDIAIVAPPPPEITPDVPKAELPSSRPRPVPPVTSKKIVAVATELPPADVETPAVPAAKKSELLKSTNAASAKSKTIYGTNSPIVEAAAFPPESSGRSKSLLIAAIALAVIGFALIALLVYRSRATASPSLITHSMGDSRKK